MKTIIVNTQTLDALKCQEDECIKNGDEIPAPHAHLKIFFSLFTHSNKRFTEDVPRPLGLSHTFKVSSTAHTQEKQ